MTAQPINHENYQPSAHAIPPQELGIVSSRLEWDPESSQPLTAERALFGVRALATGLMDHEMPTHDDREFSFKAYQFFVDLAEARDISSSERGRSKLAVRISAAVGDIAIDLVRGRTPKLGTPRLREETHRLLSADIANTSLVAKQAAMAIAHERNDGIVDAITETASWSARLVRANATLRLNNEPLIILSPSALMTKSRAREAFLELAISSIDELSDTLK